MNLEHRSHSKRTAIAVLTCALALPALGAARLVASSFIRPVSDIADWNPETDGNRLEPGLLSNLSVAICDDHFPVGSLARDLWPSVWCSLEK